MAEKTFFEGKWVCETCEKRFDDKSDCLKHEKTCNEEGINAYNSSISFKGKNLKKERWGDNKTVRLLTEKKKELDKQRQAGIFITIIEAVLFIYFLITGSGFGQIIMLFIIFIILIISLIGKTTPYQLKNQIKDVDIELSKLSSNKK